MLSHHDAWLLHRQWAGAVQTHRYEAASVPAGAGRVLRLIRVFRRPGPVRKRPGLNPRAVTPPAPQESA